MKIGVIGAGTMGQGIAKAFAQVEGNTVALCDIKQEWAENGLAKIKKGYEKLVAKGKMTQEKADAIVAAITPGLKENLCADCDLIVEAAFEDMKVKQTTFGELDAICKPECIFASNTSSLSITEIGKNVAMQIAALNPRFWDKSQVTDEVLAEEKKIALALMDTDPKMASKPAQVKEKIVMGKMNKFYEENCLLQMEFVRSDIFQGSVEKYIADAAKKLGGSVKFVDAVRFQTGEGIEKKQEDFAAEVAAQMNMGK